MASMTTASDSVASSKADTTTITKDLLVPYCRFLSEVLGPKSEVVLHDARTGAILWISENPISGRKVGEKNAIPVLRMLDEKCGKAGSDRIIGLMTRYEEGSLQRTSNLMVRQENELRYVICVNQDLSELSRFHEATRFLFDIETAPVREPIQNQIEDIEAMVTDIILEEVKHADVYRYGGKQAKMTILSRLRRRGVFKVKQAVPKVCELLHMAQPTLYKYLKQLEETEGEV
jgi:predicted transcriptional regulator YheO